MTPDLVIFDCDGVLVDSEPLTNAVMAEDLTERGLPLTAEEAMTHFIGGTIPGVAVKARDMGADIPDDWVEQIYTKMYARLREGVDPIPGVIAVLDTLDAAGLPYCVASNGSDEKMEITLGATGMTSRMKGRLFSAHALGVSKPDPDLFEIAARDMGVTPDRAVVIEDSATGALAAKRAGMACFGYAPEDGEGLAQHGATIFRDMHDLPALLGLK